MKNFWDKNYFLCEGYKTKISKKKRKLIIGKKIQKLCKRYNVKFIINDEPVLAKKLGADGCHLGQMDMNIRKARKIKKIMPYKRGFFEPSLLSAPRMNICSLVHTCSVSLYLA